jgi:ubiquinone/menaquinone biosynthesis C-methylase UbiE
MNTGSTPTAKWPKQRPELSQEQRQIMRAWYDYWLPLLNKRFGLVGKFNHNFALRTGNRGLKTLEIGVGEGRHAELEASENYYGIELTPDFMQYRARMVAADAEKGIPFQSNSFDRVLAIHVLEHLANLPAALQEVSRVMRPGGIFSVVIPCEGGIGYSIGRNLSVRPVFEKKFGKNYDWMIAYDHINTAVEVLAELRARFRVTTTTYFPLKVPMVDANLCIGLEMFRRGC